MNLPLRWNKAFYGIPMQEKEILRIKCKLGIDNLKKLCYTLICSGRASIAQMVEQQFRKLQVKGSSPFAGSIFFEV